MFFRRLVVIVFFLIFIGIGLGFMLSDKHLLDSCGRGCSLHAVFFVLFGNHLGKILAGIVVMLMGGGLLWIEFKQKAAPDGADHANDASLRRRAKRRRAGATGQGARHAKRP